MKKILFICLSAVLCAGGAVRAQSSGEEGWFPKKILVEEFSSSTCTPCAQWNTHVFNPVFDELDSEVALVKYQMNFPSGGDAYYTVDGGSRKVYYNVGAAPKMAVNGEIITLDNSLYSKDLFANYMRDRISKAGKTPFNIVFETLTMSCSTKELTVTYRIETKAALAGARLHTAIVERETSGNKNINRETLFHHVMMAMQPDGNGLSMDLKADTVYRFTYTIDMDKTHMEECDDLMAVCFIQGADKAVWQSAIQSVTAWQVGNENMVADPALSLYPNPASESVTLQGLDNATVELFDLSGRLQFAANGVSGDYTCDVRDCKPGFYVLKIREAGKVSAARLSIVR